MKAPISGITLTASRRRFDIHSVQQSSQFSILESRLQNAIQRLDQQQLASAEGMAHLTRDVNSLGRNTNRRLARSDARTKRQFAIARQEADARHSKTDTTLKNQYDAWKNDHNIQKVLSSLEFPQMNERQSNIHDVTPGTVEWIFLSQAELDKRNKPLNWKPFYSFQPTWDNFGEWLRSSDSTFWICGKLGSGKSTLMASLMGTYRGRVKEALQEWSATSQVHLFSYFFWRPGSELQKSTSGLLRSLLYQVFQAEQDSILSVLSKMSIDITNLPLWNERTLSQVLVAALSTLCVPCCIFIDGLDEFLGDYDHLLDVISNLQHLKNVKVCVSSRPEVQLRNRLDDCKQLRLQDLNYHDISVFVKQRLDRVASRLQGIDRSTNLHHLISHEADGVFLWAVLVTQALIDGASTADDADTLRKRIEMMPRHIEGLFHNMLGAIDELHKDSLAFYMKILLTFGNALDPLEISRLISIAVVTAARAEGAVIWDKSFVDLCKDTEAQIIGHSAGMIEIRQRMFTGYLDEEEWHSSEQWFIIKDFDDIVEKSSPCKSCIRNESAKTTQPFPPVLKYEANYPYWVHRSAYDFINNPVNLEKSGLNMMSTQECYRRVFRAATRYMRSAPSTVPLAGNRLYDILQVLQFHWVVEPSLIMELTSEVHSTVLHMNHEEFTNSIGLEGELALHYRFWTFCKGSLFDEYGLCQVSTIPLALLTLCLLYSHNGPWVSGYKLAWKISKRIIWLASYLQLTPLDLSTSVRVIKHVNPVDNFMISYNSLAKDEESQNYVIELFTIMNFAKTLEMFWRDCAPSSGNSRTHSARLNSSREKKYRAETLRRLHQIAGATNLYIEIADENPRLSLQLAAQLLPHCMGPDENDDENQAYMPQWDHPGTEKGLRLICMPWRKDKRESNDGYLPEKLQENHRFIMVELRLATSKALLGSLATPKTKLVINPIHGMARRSMPQINAKLSDLEQYRQMIIDDIRANEQGLSSSDQLFALTCAKLYLLPLLKSIHCEYTSPTWESP